MNGCKHEVLVDDHVPCYTYGDAIWLPKFAQAHGPELWVIILEKVWAMIHGSYDRIISGSFYETTRALTGAPGFLFDNIDKDANFFQKILDWD